MNHHVCLLLLLQFSVLHNMAKVSYTTEQHVCFTQFYFKYESARKCSRQFQHISPAELVSSRQSAHHLVSKLKKQAPS
jgi:hypothetical protein